MQNGETQEEEVKTEANTNEEVEVEAAPEESESTESTKDEYKDKYFYIAAEMQNMQKRFEREKENLFKYGNEKIMTDLVDIIDNFERTLGFIENDEDEKVKNIAVGIQMINKLFNEKLERHGLKKIEALDVEFNPEFHEALSQRAEEGKANNTVVEVYQNGYTLNDRVIRAAKVIIAKND